MPDYLVPSCKECAFMRQTSAGFVCVANPPKPFVVGYDPETNSTTTLGVFPPVQPNTWCGAFKPKFGTH